MCTGTALTMSGYVLPAYLAEMNVKRLCKAWEAFLSGERPPKLRAGTSIDFLIGSSNQKTDQPAKQHYNHSTKHNIGTRTSLVCMQ